MFENVRFVNNCWDMKSFFYLLPSIQSLILFYFECVYQENVDLQLELAYRQRLAEVHQAVKRRLVSKTKMYSSVYPNGPPKNQFVVNRSVHGRDLFLVCFLFSTTGISTLMIIECIILQDYQVERQNAVKQFEQKHVVNWIIQNVMKSITPQQVRTAMYTILGSFIVFTFR